MKLLITGAAGFIGYHLSRNLLEGGHEILGIDNLNNYYSPSLKKDRINILQDYQNFNFNKVDICNKRLLKKSFESFNPEKVINMAAQPGVRYSLENPYAYMNSNLVGFINIIELSKRNKVEGFIYASSSSVYGNSGKIPFNLNDSADKPLSLYGATKRSNELIAYSYSNLYELKTTGLRFFTVYGPWYRPDMSIFIFTKKIIENKPITVFNNGKLKRDFIFIDDIIDGTISAIEKNYNCEIFNLGNNKSEKLIDIINIIESELNNHAEINYEDMRPGDAYQTYANIEYSKEKLDFTPSTNLKDGIPIFIDWYKEYYNV